MGRDFRSSNVNSLAHTKWNCKYHIVIVPKYRRQVIYGKKDIGMILRQLCERKSVEIIEAEACKDHIHMLVNIPPKINVSSFIGYSKGKSSLMLFDRNVNLKYRYGNIKFWCKGFYVDTVGRNKKVIQEYIRNQIQDDIVAEQLSIFEYISKTSISELTGGSQVQVLYRSSTPLYQRFKQLLITRKYCGRK